MKLSFYGADREVTGSCHGVEIYGKKVLVDCGLFQGSDNGFGQDFPFLPSDIDCVVVTHAHIDHSGRLPLLCKQGFRGKIYATGATCKLLRIMLRDSAYIQEVEAGWKNRKNKRAGQWEAEPLYTLADAEAVFPLLVPCRYGERIEIDRGLSVRFADAGHLLGSAFVEMFLHEHGVQKKIVFSGDIGNCHQPMIRDPQWIGAADYVVMESTYGDRKHSAVPDFPAELARVIDGVLGQGGNVVFPSFAVGRTQELLYYIREGKERGLVKSAPDFPVYVDSPLASAATKIYEGDLTGYLDEEALAVIRAGKKPISFQGLRIVETVEESKALNEDRVPKVIISSSGMCEAGRIRHHLKHNLWRKECAVVFVGFQARGTLGRVLLDGETETVTLFGEEIAVRCRILSFQAMSAHADKEGLMRFVQAFDPKPGRVFVVHGEDEICRQFARDLMAHDFDADAPKYAAVFDLAAGAWLLEGQDPVRREAGQRESSVYRRLLLAGRRLMEVIGHNQGGANKDLAKFADQILSLADKWDR